MNRFPKITPGNATTYNRKFRRALRAIAMRVPAPARAGRAVRPRIIEPKRYFALLSNLIGETRAPGHDALVAAFLGAER